MLWRAIMSKHNDMPKWVRKTTFKYVGDYYPTLKVCPTERADIRL